MDRLNKLTPVGIDFEHIFNLSPDPVCILDLEHTIIRTNHAFTERAGISSNEVIGAKCFRCVHQVDEPPSFCILTQMLKEGKKVTADMPIECLDGWFSVTASPLRNTKGAIIGAIHIARDITEQKRLEETLYESQAKYQAIFESTGTATLIVEEDTTILMANIECYSVTGYTPDELVGQKWIQYVAPESLQEMMKNHQLRRQNPDLAPKKYEVKLVNKKGERRDALLDIGTIAGTKQSVVSILDITENKQMEEALRESEKSYRLLAESSPEMIYLIDKDGYIKYVNSAAAANFRQAAKNLFGKHLTEIFPLDIASSLFEKIKQICETKQKIQIEIEEEFPTGKIWIDVHLAPLLDESGGVVAVLGLSNDITDRKKSEVALQESEERYRTLTENIGEGVSFINEEETFVFANPAAERIFGVGEGELTGLCLTDFLLRENIEIIKTETLKRRRGESSVYEHEIVLKDGSKKDVLVTATPSFDGNKFIGTFSIFHDITERKLAQEEIKQKNEELSKLNAEKDKLFSIVAHDLKSPFNSLLGFTELLEKELPTMTRDQIQQIAVTMRKSATNLYSLLENLLEWSRLQRGLIPFNPEPLLLMPKVLADTVFVMELANKKEIEIKYDIPEDLKVYADENMLGGILRNLASNAVKFTPKGGKVTISAKPLDHTVEFSVSDTGIGMSQETVKHLFKPDVDTSRKGTDNEPSTGLGLIICKEFIEKHSGMLHVESEQGKGSTFHFTLPAKASA